MRRYQTFEFKISIFLVILFLFIPPKITYFLGNLKQLEYGFLFKFLTIIQDKDLETNMLIFNLFNVRNISFNILNCFLNIILIYVTLIILKKLYIIFKIKSNKK